ncbi:hypothetical protein P280DRAFT_484428 [Massarina eburnea CBS 473.64]|uniref:SRR1-like domain-containing protein n=1 Tax=Massarina eburnea CBS 473.64 TaxID=1395130 RepID=A0A6A6RMI5_9PLEO|nr:hypothetical protein P280DRAFT_484428 [Massarina eburnea CBS 473.64]
MNVQNIDSAELNTNNIDVEDNDEYDSNERFIHNASVPRTDVESFSPNVPIFTRDLLLASSRKAESYGYPTKTEYFGYVGQILGRGPCEILKKADCDESQLENEGYHETEALIKDLKESKRGWERSHAQRHLVEILRQKLDPAKYMRVKKIVCFGLGNMRTARGEDDTCYRDMHANQMQHLVACTIANTLSAMYAMHDANTMEIEGGNNTDKIEILSQDPAYDAVEKKVLSSFSPPIQVLDDPHGFLSVDEHTLTMPVFCSQPTEEIIADLLPNGPAAMLTNVDLLDPQLGSHVEEDRVDSMSVYDRRTPKVVNMYNGFEETYLSHSLGQRPNWEREEKHDRNTGLTWLWRMKLYGKKLQ